MKVVLKNNALKEFDDMKKEIKNLKTSTFIEDFSLIKDNVTLLLRKFV